MNELHWHIVARQKEKRQRVNSLIASADEVLVWAIVIALFVAAYIAAK